MTAASRLDRWLWPLGLAVGLSGMISVSLTLLWFAVHHPDTPVVRDAWLAERELHVERAAEERARAAGLAFEVSIAPAPGGVRLESRVLGARTGALPESWRVRVRRERPAEGGLDADFDLERDGDVFAGVVPLPHAGRWNLIARASERASEGGLLLERRLAWLATP